MRTVKFLLTLFLLMAFVMSCVDSIDNDADSDDNEIDDTISGIYYLYGPRTTMGKSCARCPAEQDSLREYISFSVIARLDHDNTKRIQFYGVEGADTGEFGKRVFPDCTRSEDCEVFGEITSSSEYVTNGGAFEIDIENNGHRYQATGSLGTSSIDLKGQYTYEDITINYDLNGERVYLTLDSD